jgi:hypothetical protein
LKKQPPTTAPTTPPTTAPTNPIAWKDPDDAPALTEAFFEGADLYNGTELKARGQSRGSKPAEAARQLTAPIEPLDGPIISNSDTVPGAQH